MESPDECNIVLDVVGEISLSTIKKATDNFSKERLLGEGGFAKVYAGGNPNHIKWAVKRANERSANSLSMLKDEVQTVYRQHHKNLLKLIGFCIEDGENILVYEYVSGGTLKKRIQEGTLTFTQIVKIAMGVAEAIKHLHENQPGGVVVLHGDIKSSNVLLGENMEVKVADFGLSKSATGKGGVEFIFSGVYAGTHGYIDPILCLSGRITLSSDIFSFGVLLLEMISGKEAVILQQGGNSDEKSELLYDWAFKQVENGNIRKILDPRMQTTEVEDSHLERYIMLARECTSKTVSQRPSMGHIISKLHTLYEDLHPLVRQRNDAETLYKKGKALIYSFVRSESKRRDFAAAALLLRQAANQDCAAAQYELAELYGCGLGVPRDEEEKRKWHSKAARQGFGPSLAACHHMGWNLLSDEEAASLLEATANADSPGAFEALGRCYEKGIGVSQSLEQAAELYLEAAELNHVKGQIQVGLCYHDGLGCPEDLSLANKWFQWATQDNVFACSELGNIFFEGRGVKQAFRKAFLFMEQAIVQGDMDRPSDRVHLQLAHKILAQCYLYGYGTTKDPQKAFLHLERQRLSSSSQAEKLSGTATEVKKPSRFWNLASRRWASKVSTAGSFLSLPTSLHGSKGELNSRSHR